MQSMPKVALKNI